MYGQIGKVDLEKWNIALQEHFSIILSGKGNCHCYIQSVGGSGSGEKCVNDSICAKIVSIWKRIMVGHGVKGSLHVCGGLYLTFLYDKNIMVTLEGCAMASRKCKKGRQDYEDCGYL